MRLSYLVILKTFTFKRAINAVLCYLSYILSLFLKKPLVWGHPPVVMIEVTNICNLKCPLCPSGNGSLNRKKGYMELDLFKKIIDQIKDTAVGVILWNQGEPFLNKDLVEMIKYASKHKLHTMVSTNANIDIEAKELVKSGLDTLIISMDGATQDTYNRYRVNGDISKVYSNIEKIVTCKKKVKKSNIKIYLQFLVMKHNEGELKKMEQIAKKLEVDSLLFKSLQIYNKSDIDNYLPINPKYRRYKIKDGNFELKFGIKNRCYRLWLQPVINWDGEVSVCCFDKDIDYPMGNINDEEFQVIRNNDKFNNFRKKVLYNRKKIPMCCNCGEGVKLKIKLTDIKKK